MSADAVTLFSGLGSSSLALRDLGFDVLAHDLMRESVETLEGNGFDVVPGDVREVDFNGPEYADVRVVAGGPPCQPFSQGGRNRGADDTRDMIPDFQRCVAHTLPELFLLENVRGLASPRHRDYLAGRVSEFEAIGYRVGWRVLDASEYEVPQSRKRLFMLGIRADLERDVAWLEPSPGSTMAEALGWDADVCIQRNHLAPEPAWDPLKSLWALSRPSTTVVGSFRPDVQAAPGYRGAGAGPRQNAPGSVVTTVRERLILQQMPTDWYIAGSRSKVDLQIGNTVPNHLIRRLLHANVGSLVNDRGSREDRHLQGVRTGHTPVPPRGHAHRALRSL